MLTANLLAKKRDGRELTDDEVRFLIQGFCDGSVADYQMSALTMAVCLRGMTARETATLTRVMLESGDVLDRRVSAGVPRVDKHSTGGLGDKVSLVLAPLLAACGVHVPMISGRGLGLTGGTLDKLESIAGFQTGLNASESQRVLQDAGAFIVSASERIAPADRKLYALRDVTGTVESIPLITASILSKKLAASLDALVMDVKAGGGAFMKTTADAQSLAESLQRVGAAAGLPTSVLISDMDQPLGSAIGNANEVNEAVAILQNRPDLPPNVGRVRELTISLCAALLKQTRVTDDLPSARDLLERSLADGSAMERFERMVAGQGGRWKGQLEVAQGHPILATRDGFVAAIDCYRIGSAVVALGGGRKKVGDLLDHSVGIDLLVQMGDQVKKDDPLMILHCHEHHRSEYLKELASGEHEGAVTLTERPVEYRPLVIATR